jgi:transcriptional regulator with XRE-family HTH domain
MIDTEKIAAKIQAKMRTRNLTQESAAAKARISQSQVSRLLAGRFRRRSKCLEQLCRVLGVATMETCSKERELTVMLHSILRRRPARAAAVRNALRAIDRLLD